jgi:hypothetical protein
MLPQVTVGAPAPLMSELNRPFHEERVDAAMNYTTMATDAFSIEARCFRRLSVLWSKTAQ